MEEEKVGNPQEKVEDDPRAPKFQQEAPINDVTPPVEISTKDTDSEIPERYRGKSTKEIAQMHTEAEKVIGRQGQRLGEYKGLLSPHVEFDSEGRVTAFKQPQPRPQPVSPPEPDKDLENIEQETGVPAQAIQRIEKRIEQKFRKEMMQNLSPIAVKLFDNDLKETKQRMFSHPDDFPNAKEWEPEIDAELINVPPEFRPRFVGEKYLVVAGRKSLEAKKKTPPSKPPTETNKPFVEGAGKTHVEVEKEYDPYEVARQDALEREKLRGIPL